MDLKAQTPKTVPANPSNEFLIPTTTSSLFWRPRFIVDSPILVHAPFIFWLSGVTKIQQVAVIGAGDGVAHFLFCQCIDKLVQHGRCYGFGFWRGNSSAQVGIPSSLTKHSDHFYDDISDLRIAENVSDALAVPGEASLDAIFIDLAAVPDGDVAAFDKCARLLREQAVVLIHGTNRTGARGQAGQNFLKQFKAFPKIEFSTGSGLTVFLAGQNTPSRLRSLIASAENGVLPPELDSIFRRLGNSIAAIADARSANDKAKELSSALKKSETALGDELRRGSTLQQSYDERGRKLAEAQSINFDSQTENSKMRAQNEALKQELERANAEVAQKHQSIEHLQARIAASERTQSIQHQEFLDKTAALKLASDEIRSQLDTVEASRRTERQTHVQEVTALTKIAEDYRTKLVTIEREHKIEHQRLLDESSALQLSEKDLRSQLADVERKRDTDRQAHFEETTALTKIAEELGTQRTALKRQMEHIEVATETVDENSLVKELRKQLATLETIHNAEKNRHSEETAVLTKMIEVARVRPAENRERESPSTDIETTRSAKAKSRRLERWLVKWLSSSDRKIRKYDRDRVAFFRDSKSFVAKIYFLLRP